MSPRTKTSSFGVSRRESHDSSRFYDRNLFVPPPASPVDGAAPPQIGPANNELGDWVDQIHLQSSESTPIASNTVALAFTSPPYNVGKAYDPDLSLEDYLGLIQRVAQEVYRALRPGGRYVVNIANIGRKPYIPLHAHFYAIHQAVGFLPMGEIIWQKGKGANGNCAWGSWRSARSPQLRDLHEYLLIFGKQAFSRPEKGVSDISGEEFMEATLSVWQIPAESARKVGHPAPFPLELAERVIKLYSYVNDVVLDPFAGSGTTCLAAKKLGRRYIGFDTSPEYVALANKRLAEMK